ncbi:hypothetical protein CFP56_020552 [Quercus suber]|uniref:Uncharacterized protein n=1 Tax=Quercus suber TaxID=58331 RepID=A0AAW0KIU7_QUESU
MVPEPVVGLKASALATGPSLKDPEKLRDLKLGKQYENVDWYKFWVWDRSDNEPRPKPNRPCGGIELPVYLLALRSSTTKRLISGGTSRGKQG